MHKLYNGDCLEVMKRIPDKSIDMVLCDLPYGTTQNKWDSIIDLGKLWEAYLRILKDFGIVALTCSQPFTSVLVNSNLKMYKHEWIWIKNRGSNFLNSVREPMKEHESVIIFGTKNWTYNKQMQERTGGGKDLVGRSFTSINRSNNYESYVRSEKELPELRVPTSWQKFNTDTSGLHPTIKPVPLFEYLIKTYTNEGDTVLDNCAGSGTTGITCKNLNRNSILIEQDKDYCKIIQERFKNHAQTSRM